MINNSAEETKVRTTFEYSRHTGQEMEGGGGGGGGGGGVSFLVERTG